MYIQIFGKRQFRGWVDVIISADIALESKQKGCWTTLYLVTDSDYFPKKIGLSTGEVLRTRCC